MLKESNGGVQQRDGVPVMDIAMCTSSGQNAIKSSELKSIFNDVLNSMFSKCRSFSFDKILLEVRFFYSTF